MRRLTFAAISALTLLITLLVSPADAVRAPSYSQSAVTATNNNRARHDLTRLQTNACLQQFANKQAALLARTKPLEHQDLGPILNRCGLSRVGENIAYGYPSGNAVVRGWMNSPGHRANILNRSYRLIAIGAVQRNGVWWVSQVFGARP